VNQALPREQLVRIGTVVVETVWLAAQRAGSPTIVFLHEGLGCVSLWRDFPFRLAEVTGCAALLYSRHGYGKSTVCLDRFEPDYMHREALETLPVLLDYFGIQDLVLYGHSDGASIALIFGGGAGRAIRGIAVEAPHVLVEPESLAGIAAAKIAFENGALKEGLARHHRDAERTFRAWNNAWKDPRFRDWNIEAYLPAINVPVLMIQGQNDAYGTLDQLETIEQAVSGPTSRLVLDECGHSPHREMPDAVINQAAEFVNGLIK